MQLGDAAGYFKKYWKDRVAIGAGAAGTASPVSAPSSSTSPVWASGRNRRGGVPRRSYEEERLDRRMVQLQALVNTPGENPLHQADIDALKTEIAAQRVAGAAVNERELARLLNKALVPKSGFSRAYNTTRDSDSDLWESMENELEALRTVESKPESTSADLRQKFGDTFAAFLGPAGPLFQIGRELKAEFGDDARKLLGLGEQQEKTAQDSARGVRRWGQRAAYQFTRWLPRLRNGLNAAIGRARGFVRSVWDRLRGRAFGRAGGAVAKGAVGGGAALLRNPRVLAATAAATGIGAALTLARRPDTSTDADRRQHDTEDTGETRQSMLDKVQVSLKGTAAVLGGLFSGLGDTIGAGWSRTMREGQQIFDRLGTHYENVKLSGRVLKDEVQQAQSQLWDDLRQWIGGVWDRVKSVIPQSARNVASAAVAGAKRLLGIKTPQASDTKGGDGTASPSVLSMAVPPTPAGNPAKGESAVRVASGAETRGMNPVVMSNFYAMADEFYNTTGRRLQLNSAKRDSDKQSQLYAANPGRAARPGYSMHEYGFALDINSAEANAMASSGLLSKYGFMRPIAGETWHLEPIAIQGQKAAIRAGQAVMDAKVAATAGTTPTPKAETEGAADPQLRSSATPVADAARATAAKYKASDNYGDGPTIPVSKTSKPREPSVTSVAASAPTATSAAPAPTVAAPAPAVAQSAEDAGNTRVPSRSRQFDVDVAPESNTTVWQPHTGSGGARVSVQTIPSHVGGMGFLNMNLGAA